MIWLFRRLLGPVLVATAVCTVLAFLWKGPDPNTGAKLAVSDGALGYLIILPFALVGMVLLVPMALALRSLQVPDGVYPILVILVGAVLGIVVVLPISQNAPMADFALAAACGAVSASVWTVLNRGPAHRPA